MSENFETNHKLQNSNETLPSEACQLRAADIINGIYKRYIYKTRYARSALALHQGMSLYLPWVVDFLNILTSF